MNVYYIKENLKVIFYNYYMVYLYIMVILCMFILFFFVGVCILLKKVRILWYISVVLIILKKIII